ncbi:hypothetical protein LXL04_019340 [Taraxacum kok-saghyz]
MASKVFNMGDSIKFTNMISLPLLLKQLDGYTSLVGSASGGVVAVIIFCILSQPAAGGGTTMVLSDHNNRSSPSPRFCNSFANRIFSDVAGDITITIDDTSFLLHKFPLVSQSGKIRKMVAETKDTNLSKLDLINFPGGPEAFELAAKFCYGVNFEITPANVAHLHCAASYLEMTENYRNENLIARTQSYLDDIVSQNLEKSIQVLRSCDTILPIADDLGITNKLVEFIADNACKEQLVAGLSRLECDNQIVDEKGRLQDWWIEDLSGLNINFYQRVISVMVSKGIRQDSVISSIMYYARESLKGIGKTRIWNPARTVPVLETGQRVILETLESLLPMENTSLIPIDFLFGMLRMAIMVDSSLGCRLGLERRIAVRLEMVSLDDLLVPSVQTGDCLFDVDTIHRILVQFLQMIEDVEDDEDCGYESDGDGGVGSTSHNTLLKVGRIVDAYLAEIAPDPYLSLQKFVGMIEVFPDYARVIDDGLYRAVDIYLKAHPMLTENERKRVCKFIDCEKLSQEASNHAAQNDRLPAHMAVRVLYFEQLRLRTAITGPSAFSGYMSRAPSGAPSAAMSPRDTYASLRRENRDLKLEISRMRVRLSDLEKEQVCMKQGMMDKSGNGKTFLTSISKIFAGPMSGKQHKSRSRRRGYSIS